jgi:hypothetical protein
LPGSIDQVLSQQTDINLDDIVSQSIGDAYRYIANPLRYTPGYENTLNQRDVYYVPNYSLRSTDPLSVDKRYVDINE